MNYDEITEITTERIKDYMKEAVNADREEIAGMYHNAAWGVHTLWFALCSKIHLDMCKKDRFAAYKLRDDFYKQDEEFKQMTDRERVPLLKSPE
ncbi:hypothetical protein [Dickeya sp. NCPPB 3274]|uniref:hypothetical protein n=1 Tax=Dickeya sp. NCPPB 3274 TaxID=568766 RepID=UPI0005B2FCBA|nr:hypothetical protein [Dickeya sp. NCPPB 3274]